MRYDDFSHTTVPRSLLPRVAAVAKQAMGRMLSPRQISTMDFGRLPVIPCSSINFSF